MKPHEYDTPTLARNAIVCLYNIADQLEPYFVHAPRRYKIMANLPHQIRQAVAGDLSAASVGALTREIHRHKQNLLLTLYVLTQPDDRGVTLRDADFTLEFDDVHQWLAVARRHALTLDQALHTCRAEAILRPRTTP